MSFGFIKYIPLAVIIFSIGYSAADVTRLSKLRPRTVVYLYNGTKDRLKSTFTFEATDRKPVDNAAHYPNFGDVSEVAPIDVKAGIPLIAELARNRGIERNRTYVFTETINLPGVGPILELKQHITGNPRTVLNPLAFGSTIKAGFAVPSRGIEPQYFDDQAWHRLVVPADNGDWVVDFCFYGTKIWSDLKSQLEREKKNASATSRTEQRSGKRTPFDPSGAAIDNLIGGLVTMAGALGSVIVAGGVVAVGAEATISAIENAYTSSQKAAFNEKLNDPNIYTDEKIRLLDAEKASYKSNQKNLKNREFNEVTLNIKNNRPWGLTDQEMNSRLKKAWKEMDEKYDKRNKEIDKKFASETSKIMEKATEEEIEYLNALEKNEPLLADKELQARLTERDMAKKEYTRMVQEKKEKEDKEQQERTVRAVQIGAAVTLSVVAATWLSTKITSIRDNLLYKIDFVPHKK